MHGALIMPQGDLLEDTGAYIGIPTGQARQQANPDLLGQRQASEWADCLQYCLMNDNLISLIDDNLINGVVGFLCEEACRGV